MSNPQDYRKRMENILKPLHGPHCQSRAAWPPGASGGFPCDCYAQEALDALMEVMVEGQIAELEPVQQALGRTINRHPELAKRVLGPFWDAVSERIEELRAKLSAHKPGKDEG